MKTRNRAKESTSKDIMGLIGVVISIILLMYLLIENYMGYTGLKRLVNSIGDEPTYTQQKNFE